MYYLQLYVFINSSRLIRNLQYFKVSCHLYSYEALHGYFSIIELSFILCIRVFLFYSPLHNI